MSFQLQRFSGQDEPLLKELLLAYFKEIDPEKILIVSGQEVLDYPYLSTYWTDTARAAFGIYNGKVLIGFALVNDWVLDKTFNADKAIAEFYVRPAYRRKGAGKLAAHQLFATFPGKWEVKQEAANKATSIFWRAVIDDFTAGDYQEVQLDEAAGKQVIQLFTVKSGQSQAHGSS